LKGEIKMAYRLIYTDFWTDPRVLEEMTPEDRLFYLYLLTNPQTTNCGIYKITKKQMAFELGYSPEAVNSLMERFINYHKLIKYNPETRELAIKNWGKYNLNKGGKPVIDCLNKELKEVKDKTLIQYLVEGIKNEVLSGLYSQFSDTGTSREEVPNESCEKTPREPHNTSTSTDTFTDTDTCTETYTDTDTGACISCGSCSSPSENYDIGSNLQVFRHFEKCGFRLTPLQFETISEDIKIYSCQWLMDAAEEASNKGRLNYSYVKGILNNWLSYGKNKNIEAGKSEKAISNNSAYKPFSFD